MSFTRTTSRLMLLALLTCLLVGCSTRLEEEETGSPQPDGSTGSGSIAPPMPIGSWYLASAQGGGQVLTLLRNAHYMWTEVSGSGTAASGGSEHGTWSWNQQTGALTVGELQDNNGDLGLLGAVGGITLSIEGDVLTLKKGSDPAATFNRIAQGTGTIVGSWAVSRATGNGLSVATFLSDGTYFIGESGEKEQSGGPGVEHGAYTWSKESGALTIDRIHHDTNGDWGLSDLLGKSATVTIDGRTLVLTDDKGEARLGEICEECRIPDQP